MRLLNVTTKELEEFYGDLPAYAILSHTWTSEEVTFQEQVGGTAGNKAGLRKITQFCDLVACDLPNVKYGWVDTCCIDKRSSAELSEAINSMFRWYQGSVRCYAYLQDVEINGKAEVGQDFEACRWFTRGWTLQELLAPQDLVMFDRNWDFLGSKQSLGSRISAVTGIHENALEMDTFHTFSVACRMSWAANRKTTRVEDLAYGLMGIFDINMPMLYGEGEKAFVRLQEEILRQYDDHSIFAWDASNVPPSVSKIGALASHPSMFKDAANIVCRPSPGNPLAITNKGLQVHLPIIGVSANPGDSLGILSCSLHDDYTSIVGIPLERSRDSMEGYSRARAAVVFQYMQPVAIEGLFKNCSAVTLSARNVRGLSGNAVSQCWLHYPRDQCSFVTAHHGAQLVHNENTSVLTWTLGRTEKKFMESIVVFSKIDTGAKLALRVKLRLADGLGGVTVTPIPSNIDVMNQRVLKDLCPELADNQGQRRIHGSLDHGVQAELTKMLLRGQYVSVVQICIKRK